MKRLWRVLIATCASLGILVLIVTFTPFVSWYGGKLAGPWHDPVGDTLIVLGAGVFEDGFLAEGSVLRCMYAVRAYKAGGIRKIVVVGTRVSEHMRLLLIAEGVPADIVTV